MTTQPQPTIVETTGVSFSHSQANPTSSSHPSNHLSSVNNSPASTKLSESDPTALSSDVVWSIVCRSLQKSLSQSNYDAWFSQTRLSQLRQVGEDRVIAVISCQTSFHSSTLEKNFYAQVKEQLDLVINKNCELQFGVNSPIQDSFAHTITLPPESDFSSNSTLSSVGDHVVKTKAGVEDVAEVGTAEIIKPRPETFTHTLSSIQERLNTLAKNSQTGSAESYHNQLSSVGQASSQVSSAEQHLFHSQAPTSAKSNPYAQPNSLTPASLFSQSTLATATVDRARVMAQKSGIRIDYTFESFAVSASNEMAHAAAVAVSNAPAAAYNPLFIYGGVGVGKTHLMHAVGNNIVVAFPEKKVQYCTGEEFMNEIIQAIRTKKTILFKEKFRLANILLIDDIQFIAGKNTVQEEFFHTFNAIIAHGGQVILTSDRPPEEISLLEDRLRSRFQAGLMVDIGQPSFELRIAIVLIKSQAASLSIPMHLAQTIATKIDSARKIEGLIQKLVSEVRLKHNEITQDLIEKILSDEDRKSPPKFRIKPHDLIREVAEFYHTRPLAVRGKQRTKSLVRARHMAMYILHEDLHYTLVDIGQLFSARDHTSVLHGVEKIKVELLSAPHTQAELSKLRLKLSGEKV